MLMRGSSSRIVPTPVPSAMNALVGPLRLTTKFSVGAVAVAQEHAYPRIKVGRDEIGLAVAVEVAHRNELVSWTGGEILGTKEGAVAVAQEDVDVIVAGRHEVKLTVEVEVRHRDGQVP